MYLFCSIDLSVHSDLKMVTEPDFTVDLSKPLVFQVCPAHLCFEYFESFYLHDSCIKS